jgi:hypothetical protein
MGNIHDFFEKKLYFYQFEADLSNLQRNSVPELFQIAEEPSGLIFGIGGEEGTGFGKVLFRLFPVSFQSSCHGKTAVDGRTPRDKSAGLFKKGTGGFYFSAVEKGFPDHLIRIRGTGTVFFQLPEQFHKLFR